MSICQNCQHAAIFEIDLSIAQDGPAIIGGRHEIVSDCTVIVGAPMPAIIKCSRFLPKIEAKISSTLEELRKS